MVKISICTPSIRANMLPVVAQSLKRQDFEGEIEWLIGSPAHLEKEIKEVVGDVPFRFIPEPSKRKGDFYNLNKCLNSLFREVKGELIVVVLDGVWLFPDTLTNFWNHYENNPKALVTAVGNHYDFIDNTPTTVVWQDPRMRMDFGSFYKVNYPEMEFCVISIPREAILDSKGLKEHWDVFSAQSEKELCARIEKFGYSLWIDQSIEYKSMHNDRLYGEEEWNKHYFEGCKYMEYCISQVNQGKELLGDL